MRSAWQCRGPAGTKRKDFWLTAGRKPVWLAEMAMGAAGALAAPAPVFLMLLKHGRHFNRNYSHLQIEGRQPAILRDKSIDGAASMRQRQAAGAAWPFP